MDKYDKKILNTYKYAFSHIVKLMKRYINPQKKNYGWTARRLLYQEDFSKKEDIQHTRNERVHWRTQYREDGFIIKNIYSCRDTTTTGYKKQY
jgi:hypothetical protein